MVPVMVNSLQEQDREELVSFLKTKSILSVLDDSIIHGLSLSLEEIHCGPGFIVFKEEDESDGLYIIKEGSVEVRKLSNKEAPIAYLTAGECFGEMAIVHGGPRSATIRVPEEATILKLSKRASVDLASKFPRLAEELSKLAQKRESGKIRFFPPGLQGNTAFFDMPTVIQAVHASRQTGYLRTMASASAPEAKLTFYRGTLVAAEFRHLGGEFAVFELLSVLEPADFFFERVSEEELQKPADNKYRFRQLERLLIDGARRSDELTKLTDIVGGMQMTFSVAADQPQVDGIPLDFRDIAKLILKLVEADLTVEEMCPLVEADRYALVKTLSILLDKQILKQLVILHSGDALAPEPPPRVRGRTAEIELSNLRRQPVRLAASFYALNMVSSNIATFTSASVVRECLEEALQELSKKYPQLVGLKVHPAGKTIDVRGASPDLTRKQDSRAALNHLTMRFLQLVSAHQ